MANGHRPARVGQAMRASSVAVDENATPGPILATMESTGLDELPVVASGELFKGMVDRRAVERRLYDRGEEDATAAMMAEAPMASAASEDAIEDAVDAMLAADLDVMPVVSKGGHLDGLLVREDLRNVRGLLEVAGENQRQREIAAEAGPSRVILTCSLASVALGLVLFAIWIQGPSYGLPRWVAWIDGVAAALAFVAAVTAFSREMFSVPLWAITGVGLCFSASVAYAWHDGAWATWIQLAFGIAFLAMAAIIGVRLPRRRQATVETPS